MLVTLCYSWPAPWQTGVYQSLDWAAFGFRTRLDVVEQVLGGLQEYIQLVVCILIVSPGIVEQVRSA